MFGVAVGDQHRRRHMREPLTRSWSPSVVVSASLFALLMMGAEARAQTGGPPPDGVPPPAEPTSAPMAPPPAPEPPPPPPPASLLASPQGPLKIETPNKSTIKFGLLLQPQFQAVSSTTL